MSHFKILSGNTKACNFQIILKMTEVKTYTNWFQNSIYLQWRRQCGLIEKIGGSEESEQHSEMQQQWTDFHQSVKSVQWGKSSPSIMVLAQLMWWFKLCPFTSKDIFIIVPRSCDYYWLCGNEKLRLQMELNLLINWVDLHWDIVLDYLDGSHVITSVSKRRRSIRKRERGREKAECERCGSIFQAF